MCACVAALLSVFVSCVLMVCVCASGLASEEGGSFFSHLFGWGASGFCMLLAKRSESHLSSSMCVCVCITVCVAACRGSNTFSSYVRSVCITHQLVCSCIFLSPVLHAIPLFKLSSSPDRIPQRYFISLNAAVPVHETFFEVWQNRGIVRHAACTSIMSG